MELLLLVAGLVTIVLLIAWRVRRYRAPQAAAQGVVPAA
jgi:hypothetical protein